MKYSDEQRLQKIYKSATELRDFITEYDIKRDALITNRHLQWLITTPLSNIGEHVYHLSEEYKNTHNEIPWPRIAALRHRLVHDYDGTNWELIAKVVFNDLPVLIAYLEKSM